MLLLVCLENAVDIFVNVFRIFDLDIPTIVYERSLLTQTSHADAMYENTTHRCSEIDHGLPCNMCFLVIILDLYVDYVDRLVEVATPRE